MTNEPDSPETPLTGILKYQPFLLLMVLVSLFLAAVILRPFAEPIIMAIVLASLFYPLNVWLVERYKGRKVLAALTVVLIIVFVIIIPLLAFLSALLAQGVDSLNRVHAWLNQENIQEMVESPRAIAALIWIDENLSFIDFSKLDLQGNLMALSKGLGQVLLSRGATLVGDISSFIVKFCIMIFVSFFFIRDGKQMVERVKHLSPLPADHEEQIIDKIRNVARSVMYGSFLTAVCQGVVGGIGLAFVGIPALFWGTIMAIASLIPMVGTSLVWVPAVVYLILFGRWKSAIFLTVWSVVLVGSIDNFLRPYFMKGRADMSPFFIFLAIIGGIQVFGLAGILYGPLIFSFAAVMLYIYSIEFEYFLKESPTSD